jgi:hypothetical protein
VLRNTLFSSFGTVMAAELVHAARSENAGEPERLRLGVIYFLEKLKVKLVMKYGKRCRIHQNLC